MSARIARSYASHPFDQPRAARQPSRHSWLPVPMRRHRDRQPAAYVRQSPPVTGEDCRHGSGKLGSGEAIGRDATISSPDRGRPSTPRKRRREGREICHVSDDYQSEHRNFTDRQCAVRKKSNFLSHTAPVRILCFSRGRTSRHGGWRAAGVEWHGTRFRAPVSSAPGSPPTRRFRCDARGGFNGNGWGASGNLPQYSEVLAGFPDLRVR